MKLVLSNYESVLILTDVFSSVSLNSIEVGGAKDEMDCKEACQGPRPWPSGSNDATPLLFLQLL